jgi:hypothetical protein
MKTLNVKKRDTILEYRADRTRTLCYRSFIENILPMLMPERLALAREEDLEEPRVIRLADGALAVERKSLLALATREMDQDTEPEHYARSALLRAGVDSVISAPIRRNIGTEQLRLHTISTLSDFELTRLVSEIDEQVKEYDAIIDHYLQ